MRPQPAQDVGYECDLDRFRHFQKFRPPIFRGRKDLVVAEDWVYQMEKLYRLFRCTTTERVAFAVFVFQGSAEHWWRSTKLILRARHAEVT